jgi:protein Mpv17
MLAQCATAAFLFGSGDILAQQAIEKKGRNHDFARTARLSFYGGEYFHEARIKLQVMIRRLRYGCPLTFVP